MRTTLRRGLRSCRGVASQLELSSDDTEWLSDDDGPVPLAIVGEADEISYREGGENATHDSSVVRVFIAGQ